MGSQIAFNDLLAGAVIALLFGFALLVVVYNRFWFIGLACAICVFIEASRLTENYISADPIVCGGIGFLAAWIGFLLYVCIVMGIVDYLPSWVGYIFCNEEDM